jgi:hypothetical protein
MTETIRAQILAIRKSGVTNMFDVPRVRREAYDLGYYELVLYLEENTPAYSRFILTGETEESE